MSERSEAARELATEIRTAREDDADNPKYLWSLLLRAAASLNDYADILDGKRIVRPGARPAPRENHGPCIRRRGHDGACYHCLLP